MTKAQARRLALALPEAAEAPHHEMWSFRVRGKIFATLGPGGEWGMVKLTPAEQAAFVRDEPDVFQPFDGAWGRRGSTRVLLDNARPSIVALTPRPACVATSHTAAPGMPACAAAMARATG